MTRRLVAIAIAIASLMTLLIVFPVLGHAELVESDPADGATIETPYLLTATFSEEFDPDPERSFIRIQNAAGDVVASGGYEGEPMAMSVDLPALPPGEYRARWQTVTIDDNGVENGTFTFTVATSPTPAPTLAPTPKQTEEPGSTATPAPPATATPAPTAAPTPAPTATPTGSNGSPTGSGTDVLIALAIGVAIIGGLAFFLVRRSRP